MFSGTPDCLPVVAVLNPVDTRSATSRTGTTAQSAPPERNAATRATVSGTSISRSVATLAVLSQWELAALSVALSDCRHSSTSYGPVPMMFSRIQSAPRSSKTFLENTPNASPAWLNSNVVQRGSGALKFRTSVLSSVASAASINAAKSPA